MYLLFYHLEFGLYVRLTTMLNFFNIIKNHLNINTDSTYDVQQVHP